jgi:WD40 repeat protein
MSPEGIEKTQPTLQDIEKAQLALERKQLEIDKAVAQRDLGFANRNSGVLISAAVAFAAVIVSIAQVWVTTISKNKEIELTTLQHKADTESQERQKDRELNLSFVKFITENRQAIFEGSPEDQELFARLIPSLFPPEISAPLLSRIETTSGSEKKIWQTAQQNSGAVYSPDGRFFATIAGENVKVWDIQSSRAVRAFRSGGIPISVNFSPDGRRLLITTLDGSVDEWDLTTGLILSRHRNGSSPKNE